MQRGSLQPADGWVFCCCTVQPLGSSAGQVPTRKHVVYRQQGAQKGCNLIRGAVVTTRTGNNEGKQKTGLAFCQWMICTWLYRCCLGRFLQPARGAGTPPSLCFSCRGGRRLSQKSCNLTPAFSLASTLFTSQTHRRWKVAFLTPCHICDWPIRSRLSRLPVSVCWLGVAGFCHKVQCFCFFFF